MLASRHLRFASASSINEDINVDLEFSSIGTSRVMDANDAAPWLNKSLAPLGTRNGRSSRLIDDSGWQHQWLCSHPDICASHRASSINEDINVDLEFSSIGTSRVMDANDAAPWLNNVPIFTIEGTSPNSRAFRNSQLRLLIHPSSHQECRLRTTLLALPWALLC